MTKEIQHFIEANYNIGEPFYSHRVYSAFSARGWLNSQISATLNRLKKKGVIGNRTAKPFSDSFNVQTGKRPPKVWIRLK